MLKLFRRRLDELVTCTFLLLVFALTILHPPVFTTAGGLALAQVILWGAGILLAILFVSSRFSTLARSVLSVVLKIGPMVVAVAGYVSLRLLHAEEITAWLGIQPKDRQMMAADAALFGKTPYLWFAQWGLDGHLFQRVMASFYALYPFTPLIALGWFLFKRDHAQFSLIRRTLLISLYCGYCCYILIPVAGPLSLTNLSPFFIQSTTTYKFLTDNFRYGFDCFPSLHTANPWLLLWLCRNKLPRFVVGGAAIICLMITFSTIALRLHYGVDVLAGLAWAWLMSFAGRATLPEEETFAVRDERAVELAS
jgi:membrane-associated phospholipid phosphatase